MMSAKQKRGQLAPLGVICWKLWHFHCLSLLLRTLSTEDCKGKPSVIIYIWPFLFTSARQGKRTPRSTCLRSEHPGWYCWWGVGRTWGCDLPRSGWRHVRPWMFLSGRAKWLLQSQTMREQPSSLVEPQQEVLIAKTDPFLDLCHLWTPWGSPWPCCCPKVDTIPKSRHRD